MIEMELKFRLYTEPTPTIAPTAQKSQTDTYYDTPDYKLLRGGNFLRVRNGKRIDIKFDLDGIDNPEHLHCIESNFDTADIAAKSDDINTLLTKLGLTATGQYRDFDDFIKQNGLAILAPVAKQRTNYKITDNITISVDRVDNLGIFVEAEIMISADTLTPEMVSEYKTKLKQIAIDNGFIPASPETVNTGYVELYLYEHNPAAYDLGRFKI